MKGIADLFCEHLLHEIRTQLRNAWLRHFLTFVVPEQAEATPIPQSIFEKLRIRPTDDDRLRGSAAWVKGRRNELFSGIDELYQLIEVQERFTGSDIWRWFQASAELYLEEDMQNLLSAFQMATSILTEAFKLGVLGTPIFLIIKSERFARIQTGSRHLIARAWVIGNWARLQCLRCEVLNG